MKTSTRSKTKIRMQKRDCRRMDLNKLGPTLFCETGILWVTQSGDYHNYILLPGDKMTVTKRGNVLVETMRDAESRLHNSLFPIIT